MKSFLLVLLLAFSTLTFAKTRVDSLSDQLILNTSAPNGHVVSRLGDRVVAEAEHTLRAYYDYSVQGGASSATAITLLDVSTNKAAVLPKGAIVRDCILDVIAQPSPTPGASFSISTGQGAGDIKATIGLGGLAAGVITCVPVGTAATAIKLTADRTMTATLTGANVTSGKFYVVVHYELSDTL